MRFKITYDNLSKIKADAIASNLGPINNKGRLGSVASYILREAKSSEAESILMEYGLDDNSNVYVCKGGSLLAKRIIYTAIPHNTNDNSIDELRVAYKRIIDFAIKNKYKSLVLPLLGTDSYGFTVGEIYTAVVKLVEEMMDGFDIDFDLYLSMYTPKDEYTTGILSCASLSGNEKYGVDRVLDNAERGPYISASIRNSMDLNKIFSLMTVDEMYIPSGEIENPMQFLDDYMKAYKVSKAYFFANGFMKDDCSRFRTGRREMRKPELYRAAIILGLNRTQYLQLMSYGGYSFNPNNKLDLWMHSYLMENVLAKSMADFQDEYYGTNECLEEIFAD